MLAIATWNVSGASHASAQRVVEFRALAALVPIGATSVEIRAYQGTPVRYKAFAAIRSSAQVTKLVRAIDALPRVSPKTIFSCPFYHAGWYYALRFGYRPGESVTARLYDTCPPVATRRGVLVGDSPGFYRLVSFVSSLVRRVHR